MQITSDYKSSHIGDVSCSLYNPLQFREHLIDATRISDGKMVYIKRVKTGDEESRIACMLRSGDLPNDPHNHSVPIIEVLQDERDPDISYMVMPFLRLMDQPSFYSVLEVLDFVDQMLEVRCYYCQCWLFSLRG